MLLLPYLHGQREKILAPLGRLSLEISLLLEPQLHKIA